MYIADAHMVDYARLRAYTEGDPHEAISHPMYRCTVGQFWLRRLLNVTFLLVLAFHLDCGRIALEGRRNYVADGGTTFKALTI